MCGLTHVPTGRFRYHKRTSVLLLPYTQLCLILQSTDTAVMESQGRSLCAGAAVANHSYFNFIALKRQFMKSLVRVSHTWDSEEPLQHNLLRKICLFSTFSSRFLEPAVQSCLSASYPCPDNMWLHTVYLLR